jgi:hypothetical protein
MPRAGIIEESWIVVISDAMSSPELCSDCQLITGEASGERVGTRLTNRRRG